MTRKLPYLIDIPNYGYIKHLMHKDLSYRLANRMERTSLGRPLYYRTNVQVVLTRECPYSCPFCIERLNPMTGFMDADKQVESLLYVLKEHPDARLTITGGEPGLYLEQVRRLARVFRDNGNNVFLSINTAGYNPALISLGRVNLSVNKYVKPDISKFPRCTYQTVFSDEEMTVQNIKKTMDSVKGFGGFSFRFISRVEEHNYDVSVFNTMKSDKDMQIETFRVGDFFVYLNFTYKGKNGRIVLGDIYQQKMNDYQDGYSNIIIHPDGHIGTNWK